MFKMLLSCLVAAASLTAASAQVTRGLPEQVVPQPFGVNIHFVVPNEQEMDLLAAAGFRVVRMDYHWSRVEATKGEYDFSGYDKLVESLGRRGIRPLFILDYGNKHYDGGVAPHTDEGRAAFARFAAASAKHYADKGILWEIWNEPNLSGFWKPQANVEDYCKLALATIKSVREADPQAYIIGPASSGFPWEFFTVMGERGVLPQLDAVTVHPYRSTVPETAAADYQRLRLLLDRYSPTKRLAILSGEWGYSAIPGGLSVERQAQYLVRQWLTNLSLNVPVSIWYDWRDDGLDPKEKEHHFGTVYRDLRPKSTYLGAKMLSETLNGYRFVRRVALSNSNDYLLLFRKGKDVAFAAWTTGEAHRVTLPLPVREVPVVEMLGERGTLQGDGTSLALELSQSPRYLLPASSEALLRLATWQTPDPLVSVEADRDATLTVSLQNPLAQPLAGTLRVRDGEQVLAQANVRVAPGKEQQVPLRLRVARRDREYVAAVLEFGGTQAAPLQASPLWVCVKNALRVTLLPPAGDTFTVTIENPSGEPAMGTLRLKAGTLSASAPLKVGKGQKEATITARLPGVPAPGTPVAIEGVDAKGNVILQSEPRRWRTVAVPTPNGAEWRTWVEGDAKVPASAASTIVEAPAGLPQAGLKHAVRLDARYGAGWRFSCVAPPADALAIEGQPKVLGMWVYGDGGGDMLRCRITDSTGQTFQPHYGAVNWKGWRFVTIDLEGASGYWGGANDGVIHLPIRWNALVLLDPSKPTSEKTSQVFITGVAIGY